MVTVLALAALAACEAPFRPPQTATVASLSVDPESVVVNWGRTLTLHAVARDSSGAALADARILWSSDAPAIALVGADGTIRGMSPGRATITATSGVHTAHSAVRVHLPVASLATPSRFHALVAGGTMSLPVTTRDSLGRVLAGRVITWTSSDVSIATVDSGGIVDGVAPGTVTITATSEGATIDLTVTVALVRFVALDAGLTGHTCGLDDAGWAWCWGANPVGQLGNGGRISAATPVGVVGGHHFRALGAGGLFSCGVATDGVARCWGSGARGRLGTGQLLDSNVPVAVAGDDRYGALAVGWQHACAIDSGRATECWGGAAHGADALKIAVTPVEVTDLVFLQLLAAGDAFACGQDGDGQALCWGDNADGRLGDGTTDDHLTPTPVSAAFALGGLTSGMGHSCAIALDGTAWCWGANQFGQLGTGDTLARTGPTPVATTLRFVALSAGAGFTCGIAADGAAHCWGKDHAGQLGASATDLCAGDACALTPIATAGGLQWTALTAGDAHTCGLAADGRAYCWGENRAGQLGDGTRSQRDVPAPVTGQR